MKNCRQCGAQMNENDEYCPRCGMRNNSDDVKREVIDLDKSEDAQKEKVNLNKTESYDTDLKEKDVVILNKSEYTESESGREEQVSEEQRETRNTNNTAYAQPVYKNDVKDYDALCLIGFILTFFGGTILSLILCIIGIINFDEERKKGKGFGIAGIIINSIIIILPIILIFVILILAALGITVSNSFDGFIY